MGDAEIQKTSGKQDDPEVQKQYNHYDKPSVIISSSEEFKKFKGHKLKKAWFNERGKRCLESFLYLFDVKVKEGEPEMYAYLEIIDGDAKQVRMKAPISELFDSKTVVFAGFLPDKELEQVLTLKLQGVNL